MNMGVFPSGQWGQTVNLLLNASVVRIHPRPPNQKNPNLFPVGEGFGFFVFLGELNLGTNHKIHKRKNGQGNFAKPDRKSYD